jgi:hypothetical protein
MSTTKLENQLDTLNKNNKEMAKHIADMARRQSATQYGIGGNISVSDSEDPILRQINSGRFEIGD